MSKPDSQLLAIGLSSNEVSFLSLTHDDVIAEIKQCNSKSDWGLIIKQFFVQYKISNKTKVKVVLDSSILYTSVQLPKNELLTDEELHGIAMYKDFEGVVKGNVADYTWDYYDARTGKNARPQQNFILVPKQIIAYISEIINNLAVLTSVTVSELAMAEFISLYQYYSVNKTIPTTPQKYVKQLCIALYMQPDRDLMMFGVYQGELCYSRMLRGYKPLNTTVLSDYNDPLLIKLTTDILRLSDDFFTSQLGLPPMSKLLILIDSDQSKKITEMLSNNFRRVVDVIPIGATSFIKTPTTYSICDNTQIRTIASKSAEFLPLYGVLKEGLLESEEN